MNVDGEEESARPEETNSTSNSGGKKRANEDTDSSASKKSKKHVQPEDSNILKKLIWELSSDTTRLSEIKEKRALYREALEKRLAHYRKTNEEHEAKKKLYDAVKDQLPKEVTKSAVRKKADRAGKVYDLFFRISDDKTQRLLFIQRIKTISATSISKLSDDDIKYVASQVRKNSRQN
ncbi:unnamed protein product [Rhizophagus irregularis]|nr:unnamed protein product [Rhizophagus irregularis]